VSVVANIASRVRRVGAMEAGELLVDAVGGVRVVTLNRPSKRNVLSRAMVADLLRVWRECEASDDVKCVVLRGGGDFPCLCAGGDVRAVHDLRPPLGEARRGAPPPGALEFFEREYEMNAFLAAMRTPHVAIMDGIVMGGGCGVSIHGAFRVATERTLLSMPECAIGLVPDVGGTHFLARLPGETGTRLALTGARVGGADALATGLATHLIPSGDVPKLVDILDRATRHAASADAARDAAAAALDAKQRDAADAVSALDLGPGASRRADDDEWFAGDTIDEIRDALARAAGEGNARARESLAAMDDASPSSLVTTLAMLRRSRAARAGLRECLREELRVVAACLSRDDFYEGVRAKLVEKGRGAGPKWAPPVDHSSGAPGEDAEAAAARFSAAVRLDDETSPSRL
jgi:enoyl-CoA hydratase/carnithine racemase